MPSQLFAKGDEVLYLIDLSGYVFRAYHAISPLTSPSGEPTHAVFGTVNMLERLVRQCDPHYLAVAMDSRTSTFRKEIYPDYKATRPPPPPDLKQQMLRVAQIVEAFAIPVFQQDGVEADDLIASVIQTAKSRNLRVVIVSADKDLMQLVSPDVVMWDTMRDRVFGEEEVTTRFGVRVDQVRDYLALTGDSSDNIPGVPSVGPKTAAELLNSYASIDGIYANIEDIKRTKLRETLREHESQARLSQRLVTLRHDCTINFDLASLRYGGRNIEKLRSLYAELGFQRQLAALDQVAAAVSSPPTVPSLAKPALTATPALVTTLSGLEGLAESAKKSGVCALELLTTTDQSMTCAVIGMACATTPRDCFYIPLLHRYVGVPSQVTAADLKSALGSMLADPAVKKCGHDLKHIAVALGQHQVHVAGYDFDSLLAGYLLDPSAAQTLERLAQSELSLNLQAPTAVVKSSRGQLLYDELSVEDAAKFAGQRVQAQLALGELLQKRLEEEALATVYREIELPLLDLLVELEARGVLIDAARLQALGGTLDSELSALEKKAHQLVAKEFNVNSPRQLEAILFDELGLKPLKRTKTSRSTDAATLEALVEEHELPAVILEIRQIAKLKGTYIDALPSLINKKTGRIHTLWRQAVAATGRLSSSDPNLQNIPIRSELGRQIRAAFVAPPGFALVSADYSQIELRVLAHLSQDPRLVEAFNTAQDVHTRTAMEIFGVAEDGVTSELRRRAKAVNFGVIYGQGDSGLAKSLGISKNEAGNFIATYFRRYEGVRRFMDATLERARSGDAVRTLFGRRRLVPDIKHANRAVRLAAERIAMNTPIQGTAADLLKLAMIKLKEPVTPGTRMTLTVHDELVFEVPEAEVDTACQRVRQIMENVHPLTVPLVVDVGHGKNWDQAH